MPKVIKGKRVVDVYREVVRPNVKVMRMSLRVEPDGTVVVESCEYEEEVVQ
jgi:hypothetical protein